MSKLTQRKDAGVKTLTVQLTLAESALLDEATATLKRSAPGIVKAKSDVVRLLLSEHAIKKAVAHYGHVIHGIPGRS